MRKGVRVVRRIQLLDPVRGRRRAGRGHETRAGRAVRGGSVTRVLRPGPGSMRGLMWLARVGPSPLDPWRFAMGWSEVAARNHARRLEREGWLERVPMLRGEGSLFFATRKGVRMLGVPLIGCTTPAPIWWAHDVACAWTAAWMTVRGRSVPRSPRAARRSWVVGPIGANAPDQRSAVRSSPGLRWDGR